MTILSIIIGIIILLDVLTFLVKATGNASNFMWYLCRPLWGILGNGVYQNISMFIGLLIRLAEATETRRESLKMVSAYNLPYRLFMLRSGDYLRYILISTEKKIKSVF